MALVLCGLLIHDCMAFVNWPRGYSKPTCGTRPAVCTCTGKYGLCYRAPMRAAPPHDLCDHCSSLLCLRCTDCRSTLQAHAMQVLQDGGKAQYGTMTVREFFQHHTYSQAFQQRYFLPMCAAVWSMPNAQVQAL